MERKWKQTWDKVLQAVRRTWKSPKAKAGIGALLLVILFFAFWTSRVVYAAKCPGTGKNTDPVHNKYNEEGWVTGCSYCGGAFMEYSTVTWNGYLWSTGVENRPSGHGTGLQSKTVTENTSYGRVTWKVYYRCENCGVCTRYTKEVYRVFVSATSHHDEDANEQFTESNPNTDHASAKAAFGLVPWWHCNACGENGPGSYAAINHKDVPDPTSTPTPTTKPTISSKPTVSSTPSPTPKPTISLTPMPTPAPGKFNITFVDKFYTGDTHDGDGNGNTYSYDEGHEYDFTTSASTEYSFNGKIGYKCVKVEVSSGAGLSVDGLRVHGTIKGNGTITRTMKREASTTAPEASATPTPEATPEASATPTPSPMTIPSYLVKVNYECEDCGRKWGSKSLRGKERSDISEKISIPDYAGHYFSWIDDTGAGEPGGGYQCRSNIRTRVRKKQKEIYAPGYVKSKKISTRVNMLRGFS